VSKIPFFEVDRYTLKVTSFAKRGKKWRAKKPEALKASGFCLK
jgi:hypothetical protein